MNNSIMNMPSVIPQRLVLLGIFFQAITGIIFFLIAVPHAIYFTHDSYHYYSAAQSLAMDGALTDPSGKPFSNWPPLYPFILYIVQGNLHVIKVFHCAIYIGTLIIPTIILSRTAIKQHFFVLYVLMQSFSVTLISFQIFVLSEGVFIFLSMILFCLLIEYCKKDRVQLFVGLIMVSSLLCLQRMMGVYYVTATLFILISYGHYKKSVLYAVCSLLGLTVWIFIKQYSNPGDPFTDNLFVTDRWQILTAISAELSALFIPTAHSVTREVLVTIGAVIASVYVLYTETEENKKLIRTLFIWIYIYLILVLVSAGAVAEIPRFVMPVVPFLIMLILLAMDQYASGKSRGMLRFIWVLNTGWFVYTAFRMCKNCWMWHNG